MLLCFLCVYMCVVLNPIFPRQQNKKKKKREKNRTEQTRVVHHVYGSCAVCKTENMRVHNEIIKLQKKNPMNFSELI